MGRGRMVPFSSTQRAQLAVPTRSPQPESGWGFQVLFRLRKSNPTFASSAKVGFVFPRSTAEALVLYSAPYLAGPACSSYSIRDPTCAPPRTGRGWRSCEHTQRCADSNAAPPLTLRRYPMKFTKLTPNLIVRDVAASLHFYQTVLGL